MSRIKASVVARDCFSLFVLFLVGVSPAYAVTTNGANFDGIMSLIYDNSSGNVFIENAPLTNPAVQQLQIASTGGLFIPGNLSMPSLSPPVTIVSATANLIDVSWSGGNFLGTGSFIGNILGTGISQATLLNDLTINWAPNASSLTGGDLLYGTYGTTAGNPVLPNTGSNGFFRFFNVGTGQFFDPPFAIGFEYEMTSASQFTKVGLPLGYGNNFSVLVGNVAVATGLVGGSDYTFSGSGVSAFSLVGINPAVDASLGNAFPLYLEFDTPTASFNMTALTVGEPASLALAILGLLSLGLIRWRSRRW